MASSIDYNRNPHGRPVGARNKRTKELFERLEARGDKDPADLLSEIVHNERFTNELRVQAAGLLLPYKYSRPATTPIPRYIEHPIELPQPNTVEEATNAISLITTYMAQGKLDFDAGTSLINGYKEFIAARLGTDLEARISLLEQSQPPQRLGVSLGLGLQINQTDSPQPTPASPNGPASIIDHQPAPINDARLPGPDDPWRQE